MIHWGLESRCLEVGKRRPMIVSLVIKSEASFDARQQNTWELKTLGVKGLLSTNLMPERKIGCLSILAQRR